MPHTTEPLRLVHSSDTVDEVESVEVRECTRCPHAGDRLWLDAIEVILRRRNRLDVDGAPLWPH